MLSIYDTGGAVRHVTLSGPIPNPARYLLNFVMIRPLELVLSAKLIRYTLSRKILNEGYGLMINVLFKNNNFFLVYLITCVLWH